MNGFINYYKPSGKSSALAISKIKKLLKGEKIGHMGTLDPMASGVLPIGVGKCNRLFDFLLDKVKVYRAEFTFGYETDTLDADGAVINKGGKIPTFEEILKVIDLLVGKVLQVPPSFSAKNVAGKRSYDLARQGIFVELPPKEVEIIKIIPSKTQSVGVFSFEIHCKGGTYIRSICRDLAKNLNTYATMTSLIREKSGAFTLDNSLTEEEILNCNNLQDLLIKPDSVLEFSSLILSKKQSDDVINGRPCIVLVCDGTYKVYDDNCFIGVGIVKDNLLKIKAYIKD